MTTFKIEKNIPIPTGNKTGPKYKYPVLNELEIGDSVIVETATDFVTVNKINSLLRPLSKRLDRKFIYRKTEDGIRVWRTA